jgi:D-serine deaminase-like pyridoxal phosphate-dependent protein
LTPITDIPTPAVLVDTTRMTRNLVNMQRAASAAGLRLRPHAKTHKSIDIARMQIAGGAVGICCAKLGEAETFAAAGITDIRLPYPLHPVNANRVFDLAGRIALSFIVDDVEIAREWSRLAREKHQPLDVLIKVDVGFHRCGIDPHAAKAPKIVREVAGLPGLRFRGLLSHAGHAYTASSEADMASIAAEEARILRDLAAAAGVPCEEISAGATPPVRHTLKQHGLTEVRPGNYVFFDRTQVALGAAAWSDCALTVLARVVSRPAPDRVILDSGSKTMTSDSARGFVPAPGYGAVFTDIHATEPDPSLLVERLSEEHATVKVTGTSTLRTGDLVRIVPNHACTVTNLMDHVWHVDGAQIVSRMPVTARGRIT